jgi:hypothetical protein
MIITDGNQPRSEQLDKVPEASELEKLWCKPSERKQKRFNIKKKKGDFITDDYIEVKRKLKVITGCPITKATMLNLSGMIHLCKACRRLNKLNLNRMTGAAKSNNGTLYNVSAKSFPYPSCYDCKEWKFVELGFPPQNARWLKTFTLIIM